jgi:hypothetical protein
VVERKIGVSPEFTLKEQEIDLVDIIGFIRGHCVILLVSLILGLIGGIAIYSYLPNK